MNKTSIEWCNYTWNPVTGCLHPCRNVFCYNTMKATSPLNRFGARYKDKDRLVYVKNWQSRQTGKCHVAYKGEIYPYGYDPTFYPHRLEEPFRVKKPAKIFVVDAGDLFGSWVPEVWIKKVLKVAEECNWHTFMFLTKNPDRMLEFKFPENAWVGTSICSHRDNVRIETLKKVRAKVRFLSIEPLLGRVQANLRAIQWIIIGAQTGKNPVNPELSWIEELLSEADSFNIPVFLKHNLSPYCTIKRQEFPV